MRPARAALLALLGGAFSVLVPTPSAAAPRDDAPRALHLHAEEHYRRGEFAAALGYYQRAHRLTGLPGFLFNMAQSLRRMGQWRAALVHYQQFLVEVPQAANRDAVSELIRLCASRLPPDRAVRGSPRPPPSIATPAQQPKLVDARAIATPAQQPKLVDARAIAEPTPARGRAVLLWTGSGLAGALLVSGTVTGILALRASDEYGHSDTSRERKGELKTRGEAYRTASTVSFAVAGALAVSTALVSLLYRPRAPQRIAVSLLPGGAAFAVGQRF